MLGYANKNAPTQTFMVWLNTKCKQCLHPLNMRSYYNHAEFSQAALTSQGNMTAKSSCINVGKSGERDCQNSSSWCNLKMSRQGLWPKPCSRFTCSESRNNIPLFSGSITYENNLGNEIFQVTYSSKCCKKESSLRFFLMLAVQLNIHAYNTYTQQKMTWCPQWEQQCIFLCRVDLKENMLCCQFKSVY